MLQSWALEASKAELSRTVPISNQRQPAHGAQRASSACSRRCGTAQSHWHRPSALCMVRSQWNPVSAAPGAMVLLHLPAAINCARIHHWTLRMPPLRLPSGTPEVLGVGLNTKSSSLSSCHSQGPPCMQPSSCSVLKQPAMTQQTAFGSKSLLAHPSRPERMQRACKLVLPVQQIRQPWQPLEPKQSARNTRPATAC